MLCEFSLKMPIHIPRGEFLGVKIGVNGDVWQFYPSKNENSRYAAYVHVIFGVQIS